MAFRRVGRVGGLEEQHVAVAVDDRLEEVLLRAEVVVERALRRTRLVEDVLERHLLPPAHDHQPLGGVEEDVAPDRMAGGVQGPRHGLP